MDAGPVRQIFLRQALFDAKLLYGGTQSTPDVRRSARHEDGGRCQLIGGLSSH